jgi:Predicted membrane protein
MTNAPAFAPGEPAPGTYNPQPEPGNGGEVPPPAPPPPAEPPAPAEQHYGNIQGFDFGKLADPNYHSDKYTDSVRKFSQYLGSGGAIGRGNFDPVTAWLHANGFKDAHAVGDDKIDFGDGNGPIDVINSKGEVWFQNGADRFAPPAGASTSTFVNPFMGGGGGGGAASGGGGGGAPAGPSNMNQIMDWLSGIINSGGNFNQGAVNQRLDAARGGLERQRRSMLDTDRALMADRGLLSSPGHASGAEASNVARISQDIGDSFSNQLNGIYADEADRADSRLVEALKMATGLSEEDARNAVQYAGIASNERLGHERNGNDFFLGNRNADLGFLNADNNFTLGQGQLALGNQNSQNAWNQFVAQHGLDQDRFAYDQQHGGVDQLIALIHELMNGAGVSAGGHY